MKKFIKWLIGVIAFILILFIVFLNLTNSFIAKPKSANYEYDHIIKDSVGSADPLITDIAMLGAHDAFTNKIGRTSKPNTNEGGIVNNKAVLFIGKGLVVRMSRAQNADAATLLKAGVRYFDARITLIKEIYYTSHGLLSTKLEDYVKDIVDFLENNPGEFIIFDIQHFYVNGGEHPTDADYASLIDYLGTIKNSADKSILDYTNYLEGGEQIDLGLVRYQRLTHDGASAGAVILAEYDKDAHVYFRSNSIRSIWHETNDLAVLKQGIQNEVNAIKNDPTLKESRFVVNQAQLTGFVSGKALIKSLLKWSILDMAVASNKALLEETYLEESLNYMPIFMVDAATSTKGDFNKKINELIIKHNQSLN